MSQGAPETDEKSSSHGTCSMVRSPEARHHRYSVLLHRFGKGPIGRVTHHDGEKNMGDWNLVVLVQFALPERADKRWGTRSCRPPRQCSLLWVGAALALLAKLSMDGKPSYIITLPFGDEATTNPILIC